MRFAADSVVPQIEPWNYEPGESMAPVTTLAPDREDDATNAGILRLIVDLGNTVLTKRAMSDLAR